MATSHDLRCGHQHVLTNACGFIGRFALKLTTMKRTPRSDTVSPDRSRLTSPSPSIRHISHTRVNTERLYLLHKDSTPKWLMQNRSSTKTSIRLQIPITSKACCGQRSSHTISHAYRGLASTLLSFRG